jgi:hypothetical protein
MSTEPRGDSHRRRHQESAPVPDVVPLSTADDAIPSSDQQDDEGKAVSSPAVIAPDEPATELAFQELFDAIPPEVLRAATEPLRPDERVCVCMDDRNPDDGVYTAGGFILLDTETAIEQIRRLGVTSVKSHPGCGAGAVLAQRQGLPAAEGDVAAVAQSMRIANGAGIRYAGASVLDPAVPHAARATLVFVDIPARRSLLCEYLPPSFYVSADAYPDREAWIAEVLLSAGIALQAGDEATGGFSRERPFSVVFVGRDKGTVREHAALFQARMQAVLPVESSERMRVSTVF